jgi:NADH dehydrogenase
VPVVVIGASGVVGKALIPRLVEAGSEVRAVVSRQEPADELRRLGAKVAVGDTESPDLLAAVLRDAHTLCQVIGGLFLHEDQYSPAITATTQAAVEAAREAGLTRLILLSYPGADPASPNAYLRAKGTAEEAVRGSGLENVVVRSALVVSRRGQWIQVLGGGDQRLAPVYVHDLAAILAAADDRAQPISGTFGLQGPDTVTAEELSDLLRERSRRAIRPSRKLRISQTAAEVLAGDSLADAPDAAAEFGVKLTPLREALRASGFDTA